MREVIFSEGDFTLVKESGIGNNETPWEGLCIVSDGRAKDFVIEVRIESAGLIPFEGKPVQIKYTGDIEVAHGSRMKKETLADTEQYIEALEEALLFARRVERYVRDDNNGWLYRR